MYLHIDDETTKPPSLRSWRHLFPMVVRRDVLNEEFFVLLRTLQRHKGDTRKRVVCAMLAR
jgi:hypothetical protein